MLYALEQQTGIETVVAVVPSIGEEDCFNFCHQLLNKWGVGKKDKNNGLVILLVTDQRCIQFYTGYGLEGVLPDAICKRIQTRYMIPYLKDGNWDAGMVAGLKATCQRLDGSMENDALSDSNSGGSFDFVLAILCFIAIGGGLAFFSARKQSRCPNCGKHQLQRSGSAVVSRSIWVFASVFPASIADSRPFSLSGISDCPCILMSLFQSVCPCLIKYKSIVYPLIFVKFP